MHGTWMKSYPMRTVPNITNQFELETNLWVGLLLTISDGNSFILNICDRPMIAIHELCFQSSLQFQRSVHGRGGH
jgi:hypothetical protein